MAHSIHIGKADSVRARSIVACLLSGALRCVLRCVRMRAFLCVLLCSLVPLAQAVEMRSVATHAILYDAPSTQATPLYIALRGTPLENVTQQAGWRKVREPGGKLGWVEEKSTSSKRTLIVTANKADIRSKPEDAAPLVFEANKSVLLELVEPATPVNGWLKVRHADGAGGYVRLSQVWGY